MEALDIVTLFWILAIYITFIFLLDFVAALLASTFAWAGRAEARIRKTSCAH
jgi:hypothetical protein